MSTRLKIDDLRRAWQANDPNLVDFIVRLAQQPDEERETPLREGALTFDSFLTQMRNWPYRGQSKEERAHFRIETLKALEAPDAEVPLPERLKAHEIILLLWQDGGPFARNCLLRVIARVPLAYGPWRALKRIFKEAEAKEDTEIYGALAARFDMALASGQGTTVASSTLAYLCRRAWRFLRRTAVRLPAVYADTAGDFLAHYTEETNWRGTWIANHIFYHESKQYGRSHFRYGRPPEGGLLKNRAYPELWQRTPRPLFSLIERAHSDQVWEFATTALKTDFRAQLREVEPAWVARLVGVGSKSIDSFVVWILTNVPRFEQSQFRALGLHGAVLKLFDSPASEARAYAAEYARVHARDLPVGELVRLANNDHKAVRKLAADLLQERDPRTDVGLDAWGLLLETEHGHQLAAAVIKKSFGARELTPAWFSDRLFSHSDAAFKFAKALLPTIHPFAKLGISYFQELLDRCNDHTDDAVRRVAGFALAELGNFDINALNADFLRRLLLNPVTRMQSVRWLNEDTLKAKILGADFLKAVAFHPTWDAHLWLPALRGTERPWARVLDYDEALGDSALAWLGDVRRFAPADVGMDWLLELVSRSEPRYRDFAVNTVIKAFTPADFAPAALATSPAAAAEETKIDLAKASFLFTGKMATMVRKDAEAKVKDAKGTVAGSVTAKLHYLVIGDEGSPLYGQGKKGDKQTKAESLNAGGANIKIISETAFLQMLAGRKMTESADATQAGCLRLWEMATAPGPVDAPRGEFARKYLRRHHPDICMHETSRPVDAGAEIPADFLSFERFKPLFAESRRPLRDFAVEVARWEFARWAPPAPELVRLCELPFGDVRKFVAESLLAEASPKTARFRINPDTLSPAAVYSFCESINDATRSLGMQLIERSPRLRLPEELFRLTESPDRKVRAFVIRTLWSLYRDHGVTPDWKPTAAARSTIGKTAEKTAEKAAELAGAGVPQCPDAAAGGRPGSGGVSEANPVRDTPGSDGAGIGR